jgi:uncharacterized protein YggE
MNKTTVLGSRLVLGNLWKTIPLVLFVCVNFAQPTWAQQKEQMLRRTVTVTGRKVETIPATLAEIVLSVELQAKTAQQAQQEVARRSSAVVSLLKTRKVEKLRTTSVTLNPVYSYQNNVQRLIGYSASNTVSFLTAAADAGSILDEAVRTGATQISIIGFVPTDEGIAQAQKQALKEAALQAQQQANAVFSALGLQAKEVVSIQINSADSVPPPRPLYRAETVKLPQQDFSTSPVEAGEQQVEASVTLEISY